MGHQSEVEANSQCGDLIQSWAGSGVGGGGPDGVVGDVVELVHHGAGAAGGLVWYKLVDNEHFNL